MNKLVMSYPTNPTQDLGPSRSQSELTVPMEDGPTGSADPPSATRTREFPLTYDTSPPVMGPLGPMNVGYVHNVVSENGQWARGELPDLGWGYAFALRRPRLMREPRTDIGSVNLARG